MHSVFGSGGFGDLPERLHLAPSDALAGVSGTDLPSVCLEMGKRAKRAALDLQDLSTRVKNLWLIASAQAIRLAVDEILSANAKDVAQAPAYGLTPAATDRLILDAKRIEGICRGLEELAGLADPVGEIVSGSRRPNGLEIQKVRVPIGVLLFLYESRPNVTVDAAAIAIKSGNAIILRGGKEAFHSSRALIDIMVREALRLGIPEHAVQLVPTVDRAAVGELLKLSKWIDLVIPRGGESLVRRVVEEATMPVLKHFDGNCHVYIDRCADLEKGLRIVVNSKTQRMGVCNAAESLIVHQDVARVFLPKLVAALRDFAVELRGDAAAREILPGATPATEDDWGREYLGPILSVRIVATLDEAIEHINTYGSKHTDAIVTEDIATARRFTSKVDSAAVMVNASTRFNDGGELGLGAEIGISTDKLHARGPCGLTELTTTKYIVYGDGHVREG
jgi:glutamate-5-semialdehyde dehydrogenase